MKETYDSLIQAIKDYFRKNNISKAVVGLSGGIDSSLSARLVADAIGKGNVHGIMMPVKGLSSEENVNDATEFCRLIEISNDLIYINDFIEGFEKFEWQSRIARMNAASRIRAVILYHYANTHKALVIGTSNKTEIMLGYFTKYGDGAVDIEVISDLFKTDEVELAKYLKLPEKIINKTPTAELYHGQTDEEELGATYKEIDDILKKIDKKQQIDENNPLAKRILKMMKDNEHKNKGPFLVKIS
jgi:NAD+ synthase|tara:strand:+ start:8638 stop:9369 length:732 start_codon:yes stop_codon:yes gene_type:complete